MGSIYLKNYIVESPCESEKYKAFREQNPQQVEWALHPVEIKQRTASVAVACFFSLGLVLALNHASAESIRFYDEKPRIDGDKDLTQVL